jgi:phosphatidylserine/phosphatidylglycerophosphate/cardiolipin synthase-like enzyme
MLTQTTSSRRLTFVGFLLTSTLMIAISAPAASRSKKKLKAEDLQSRLSTTAAPRDLEVCFSPEEHCDAKLIKFIQSAEKSIDMAIYDINHEQLVHQLLVKSKKIPVRVVVDRRQSKGPRSLVSLLIKAGADVRYGRQRGIMHNKFVIVDGKGLETGSFNFTNHASEANNENQIYLFSPQVVERFRSRFVQIWQKAAPANVSL